MATTDPRLDPDTRSLGAKAPFYPDEGDLTSLVHVLWHARRREWTVAEHPDEIATAILRSRFLAARASFARAEGIRRAAGHFRAMAQESLTRREVIELLDYLAEEETG